MYQNWKLVKKQRAYRDIMPFWRAFFGFFFVYPLFLKIRRSLKDASMENGAHFPAGLLAIAWIVITLLYKLPDPFWIFSLFSFLPLLAVQARVNGLNALVAPGAPTNSRFTWANWIWLVLGSILLILAIVGTFFPPAR